jgi:N-acetylglucosaminylphosphatidylinositol deacetylase
MGGGRARYAAARAARPFAVYALETVPTMFKYWGLFYAWLVPTDGLLFVSSFRSYAQARRAMYAHESQLVWFRRLYILFSSYMCINHLRRAVAPPS